MIQIDGAEGEGGGQVVRYACALSLVTGEPFRVTRIRGGREKPGLMRQHVTAIEAACAIGGASCDGLVVGSSELVFRPGRVMPGAYRFAIGTAGSTALVLQTILLPLLLAPAPSSLVLEGGTHNMAAPPFEFLTKTFLPIVARMGPKIDARLVRHGFYPRGDGRIELDIMPAPLTPLACLERGPLLGCQATAFLAGLPFEIAEREPRVARAALPWPEDAFATRQLPAEAGPGNILLLEARFEQVTEVVSGVGQRGVAAEAVARGAAARMAGYLDSAAFAGPYLADQLLLPFALAGSGHFTTVTPTRHTLTAAALIERFLGRSCRFERAPSGVHHAVVA
jgi:RNA 3'-terminal phosphate cyclase (ATP)